MRLISFQLTASQGGWLWTYSDTSSRAVISTHSLTRRLTGSMTHQNVIFPFQLTASQGGWPVLRHELLQHGDFNSQPHKEADEIWIQNQDPAVSFQLTASQGGWRTRSRNFKLISFISTHSLTRRLTLPGVCCCPTWVVFQLTASQGGWHIFNLWFGWA